MDVNQPARSSIKRKRLLNKNGGDGEIACLLALPSDELGAILKFLPHKDRLQLAVTAKSIHREVEAFCERMMKQIRVHHNVDATFEARIRERFDNALQQQQQQQQGRTRELPQRCRLWAARTSHLYTLDVSPDPDHSSQMGYGYTVFKLAPLGDMLLTVNPVDPVYVRLWNLDTRQCVRTIPIPPSSDDQESDQIYDAFFFDDLVVTCTWCTISVWSENGELVHRYITDLIHGITPLATHHENIIFAYTVESRLFNAKGAQIGWLDVRSGTVTRDFLPSAFRERIQGLRPNVLSIFVCDNRWLVVQIRDNAMHTHQLYVFDGDDNFSQVHDYTFNCAYARIQHSPENGTTFIARQSTGSGVDVFHLVEGRVTPRFSFPVDPVMADARAFRDSAFLQHGNSLLITLQLEKWNDPTSGILRFRCPYQIFPYQRQDKSCTEA